MWKKIDSPAGEGSPIVTRYNYATGQYMRPSQYGGIMPNLQGLDMQPDNRETRMGTRIVNATSANQPNYMIGNGNSPMDRGGANMFPSPIQGYQYLTTGGYPPEYSMPQNANIYPAMFNHQTGQRIDPQSGGLITPVFKDKHFNQDSEVGEAMFGGVPEYLKQSNYGEALPNYRDVSGSGGYKYRQFADGSIQILAGKQGVGTMVYKTSPYWQLITNEIGAYPSQTTTPVPSSTTGQKIIQTGQQFVQSEQGQSLLSTLFDTFTSKVQSKQAQLDLQTQQAQAEQQKIAQSMQPTAWDKAKPYVLAVSIIGAVGTGVYFLTQKK